MFASKGRGRGRGRGVKAKGCEEPCDGDESEEAKVENSEAGSDDGNGAAGAEPMAEDPPKPSKPTASKPKTAVKSKAKAKAKAKAPAKAKAQAKAKARASATGGSKPSSKSSTKGASKHEKKESSKTKNEEEKVPEDPPVPPAKKARGESKTWAGRWVPTDPHELKKFNSIRNVFMQRLQPKLKSPSSFQKGFFKFCSQAFKQSDLTGQSTAAEFTAVAEAQVDEYMKCEEVRNSIESSALAFFQSYLPTRV